MTPSLAGRSSRNRYGDLLPYMGEVWTQQASYSIDRPALDVVQLRTTVSTPVTPATLTRTITLCAGQPRFTLGYELRNVGYLPFDYNWGIHPCLAVQPTWRFDIPATRGLVDEAGGSLLGLPVTSMPGPCWAASTSGRPWDPIAVRSRCTT